MNIFLVVLASALGLALLVAFRKAAVSAIGWTVKAGWKALKSLRGLENLLCRESTIYIVALAVPSVLLCPQLLFFIPPVCVAILKVSFFIRLAVAIFWIAPCWMKVEPYQGVVIAILGVPWRSCGSGPKFLFRPFGIPIESVVREAKIERFVFSFDMNADTYNAGDRDVVPVTVAVNGETKADALISYFKFEGDPKKREEGLTDRIKGIVTIEVFKYKSRDEVYGNVKRLGKDITKAFRERDKDEMDLQEYFGVTIDEIAISNIELTDELKQAQDDKEVAQEKAAAATVAMENFEKRVVMAQGTGEDKLGRQNAVDTVLTIDGKRKVEEKTNDIGPNWKQILEVAVPAVGELVRHFTERKPKKKKKGR